MEQTTTTDDGMQTDGSAGRIGARDVLTEILRTGAEKMLAAAIHNEIREYLQQQMKHLAPDLGERGYLGG